MSEQEDISGLENALSERARKLAEEHLVNGRQTRELMLAETRQRLKSSLSASSLLPKLGQNESHSNRYRQQSSTCVRDWIACVGN